MVERVRKGTRFTVIYRSRAAFQIVPVIDAEQGPSFEKPRQLLFRYHDKTYSFTDCTSFVIMCEACLTHALTTDAHFRQAGFHVPPATRGRVRRT